ncbi:glycosyltransferase family 2 protein [Xenorhabdus sp. Flor]|uniref:glycosyltransferase family 2 protein n=1 Tax=Xenorhabdus cabanillasii TaxID=351673 RepID=UPI00198C5E46|nr:glycosyltransferase family 2 protein [Xenorhabdus sp. Flor]MBD2816066.1 glycosyltransferase family 2 protein [Xenorhabdus sp. Flor]
MIISILSELLLLLYIFFYLLVLSGYASYWVNSRTTIKEKNDTRIRNVVIIVPVHNEIDAFKNAVKHWNSILTEHHTHIVVFVTQNKNKISSKLIKLEYERLVYSNDRERIRLMFDTNESSTKSTKLTFVINELNLSQDAYIGIFDIDTKVESLTFDELSHKFDEGNDVVQIVPLSTVEKPNGFENALLFGRYRRNISLEFGLVKLVNSFDILKPLLGIHYFCGASFFIKKHILDTLGGFPTSNDDIELGYLYTSRQGQISIVDSFSHAPLPSNNIKVYFRHRTKVLNAVFTRNKVLLKNKKIGPKYRILSFYSFLRDHFIEYSTFPFLVSLYFYSKLILCIAVCLLLAEAVLQRCILNHKINMSLIYSPFLCSVVYFYELCFYVFVRFIFLNKSVNTEPTAK